MICPHNGTAVLYKAVKYRFTSALYIQIYDSNSKLFVHTVGLRTYTSKAVIYRFSAALYRNKRVTDYFLVFCPHNGSAVLYKAVKHRFTSALYIQIWL